MSKMIRREFATMVLLEKTRYVQQICRTLPEPCRAKLINHGNGFVGESQIARSQ